MQRVFNMLFGLGVVWLIMSCQAEYCVTVMLLMAPYHVVFNK